MRIRQALFIVILGIYAVAASAQQISAPAPQPGSINGTVTDVNDDAVPGASIVIDGAAPSDHRTAVANDNGFFKFDALKPGVTYHVTVSASGFSNWTSSAVMVKPGQAFDLPEITLQIAEAVTSVNAIYDPVQIATEQVQMEEEQRVFGVIPNFYVVYDSKNAVPLTAKLKFKLMYKTVFDPVTFGAAAFVSGINQAADTPDYVQGAKGYGQRLGAAYADGVSDILIGGAILPALLHQDPRYFYQGTGTKKSRAMHAFLSPFMAKGDNGKWEFNYSSVGGDLASGALSNLYYPQSNRGVGLVFQNAGITTGGRIVNSLFQEFVLSKVTTRGKHKDK